MVCPLLGIQILSCRDGGYWVFVFLGSWDMRAEGLLELGEVGAKGSGQLQGGTEEGGQRGGGQLPAAEGGIAGKEVSKWGL